jgi:hypothetical protein
MRDIPPGTKKIVFNGQVVGEYESTGDIDRDTAMVRDILKSKGLHKEISLFQAIYNQAVAFANTSAYLYENDLKHSPRNGFSVAPFTVNAAFSIELYLKALAQKHGISLRGHELLKLYESLPEEAIREIGRVIPKCEKNRNLGEPPDFKGYLSELNNTFLEWRYCYEKDRTGVVRIEPTIFVMEVLHEACFLISEA